MSKSTQSRKGFLSEITIVMSDLNAKAGSNSILLEHIMVKHRSITAPVSSATICSYMGAAHGIWLTLFIKS